jgi:cytochrome c-type biogenesis protein CcmF
LRGNKVITIDAYVDEVGIKVVFDKIETETGKLQIKVAEKKGNLREFIVLKAIVFPFINVLWLGCILMVVGTMMAVFYRIQRK